MNTIPWPAQRWTGPSREKLPWLRALAGLFGTLAWPLARDEAGSSAAAFGPPKRFLIAQGSDGRWRVESGGDRAKPLFVLLSEAIVFARGTCEAAPATIELHIGEIVAVIHQEAGWPKSICREAARGSR